MNCTNSKSEFNGVVNLQRAIKINYIKYNEIEVIYDSGTKLCYKKIDDEYEPTTNISYK